MSRPVRRLLASLWIALWLAAPTGAQPPAVPSEEPASTAAPELTGYPIELDGEEVFRLYDFPGAQVTPGERIALAEQRLREIAEDPFYTEGLIATEPGRDGLWLVYRGRRVGFIDEEVAAALGTTAERRAGEMIAAVEDAVSRFRERREPRQWLVSIAVLAAVTLALLLALRLLGAAHRRIATWVEARGRSGQTVETHWLGFRNAARLLAFQLRSLRLLRMAIAAVLILVYLQAAFAILPLTRGYALSVLQYLLDPIRVVWNGLLAKIGDLFFIAVMVVLARLLLRGMRAALNEVSTGSLVLPGIPRERAIPLYKIARIAIVAITVVMVYPYIPGSASEAFKGISLFAGALFTLGASSAAANLIGGMVLVFSGSFKVGDWVTIAGVTGTVEESTLSLTRIRTAKNELVTLANATVLSQSFVNYSSIAQREGVVVATEITIGYDVPWRKVHELLLRAASRTEGALEEPAPFVLQTSLNDFHVGYRVCLYTRRANAMPRIQSELNQNVQDAFAEAGVEILSPAYAALRDGNASTVPEGRGDAAESESV